MITVFENRAAAVLYNILKCRGDDRPFILPANICPIVPITFLKAGIPFEFVDISLSNLHMDICQAITCLKSNPDGYGGLLYAHTYGENFTPASFFAEIKSLRNDLLIIDDKCLCMPELEPDPLTLADVTLFSTGYSKIIDLGSGGYGFIKPGISYQKHILPYQKEDQINIENKYKYCIETRTPFKYFESNWLQTDSEMPTWNDYTKYLSYHKQESLSHKRKINSLYSNLLPNEIQLPEPYQLWRFNVRLPNKRNILDRLFSSDLFASSHYASLAGIMAPGFCPNAEELNKQVVNLFNDHHITSELARKTCQMILMSYTLD
jgi:hypothetical protein